MQPPHENMPEDHDMTPKDHDMTLQQRFIRRQIFRVAAESRDLPQDSEERAASILLVVKMWEAFHEARFARVARDA